MARILLYLLVAAPVTSGSRGCRIPNYCMIFFINHILYFYDRIVMIGRIILKSRMYYFIFTSLH